MNKPLYRALIFEVVGTLLLVFGGLSAGCVSLVYPGSYGLPVIASVWGVSLIVTIYICGGASGAHFNPAVSIAMVLNRGFSFQTCILYILAQLIGAALAGILMLCIFAQPIGQFEETQGIVRGTPEGLQTARLFGCYFISEPGSETLSAASAAAAEAVGTFILALVVFTVTDRRNASVPTAAVPAIIGGTLFVIICLFAPMTQACFNPARDIGPRIVSMACGWGALPLTVHGPWTFIVYSVAPIIGATVGGFVSNCLFRGICIQSDLK